MSQITMQTTHRDRRPVSEPAKLYQARKPCGCVTAACLIRHGVEHEKFRKEYEKAGFEVKEVTEVDPSFRVTCRHGTIEEQRGEIS